jgi:hypothetical protein
MYGQFNTVDTNHTRLGKCHRWNPLLSQRLTAPLRATRF